MIREGKRIKALLDLQQSHSISEAGLESVKAIVKEASNDLLQHIVQSGKTGGVAEDILDQLQDAGEEFIDSRPELRSKYLIEKWIEKNLGRMVRDYNLIDLSLYSRHGT